MAKNIEFLQNRICIHQKILYTIFLSSINMPPFFLEFGFFLISIGPSDQLLSAYFWVNWWDLIFKSYK